MIAQYLRIKKQHPGALLFYRMGDFYELFFDDAVVAAEALDIALTRRGKSPKTSFPMCGVPCHSADSYLQTLIRKGFKVAICEQLEDAASARKRGSKSLVKRDVVRIMTPGTLTEDALLAARQHNFLAAIGDLRGQCAIAWADMSSGQLRVMGCPAAALAPQLARISPSEILVSETLDDGLAELAAEDGRLLTHLPPSSFDSTAGEKRISRMFSVQFVDGFGDLTRVEISVLGALLEYVEHTQKGNLPLLHSPEREYLEATMQIDAASRRNLELTTNLSGGREHTLLSALDRTVTAAGSRLVSQRLSAPSLDLDVISNRLLEVSYFLKDCDKREATNQCLRRVPDISRALSRLCLGRGGPRDMVAIRIGLQQAADIHRLLRADENLPESLAETLDHLIDPQPMADRLERALVDEPPLLVRDGGFVARGYSISLDQERKIKTDARAVIATLQQEYVQLTGIQSLKIRHNNVLGYFVEVPKRHVEKMQGEALERTFVLRQATAGSSRFGSSELAETASRILNADNRCSELELEIFENLRIEIDRSATTISLAAGFLARLDVAAAFAKIAQDEQWVRPIVDGSDHLEIVGGRHPVVEQSLRHMGEHLFVANDCTFGERDAQPRISLVTGPNMAGKSTYLRQNALIVLMAQSGSFVPASSARIGLVSQLFSRVGAADELARGRSTFMVEMVETAAILNQADHRAFVILDEIGRGTATYDGLSIAWATLEYIHDSIGCRTLFATHFHELTQLTSRLQRLRNLTLSVADWDGKIVFLHEVREGAADRSYGVHVARLAGVPGPVVERADVILDLFESEDRDGRGKMANVLDDLPLFVAASQYDPGETARSPVEDRLLGVTPDELTPIDALELVYELKKLAGSGG